MCDLVDKKGIPGSMEIGPGIFFTRTLDKHFSRRRKMNNEQAHLKMTILLIKDWDGFQLAMRGIMICFDRRGS
ncbi:hypothetical protein ACFLYW_01345 [Thermodesulfobacteriota bacterium]